MNIVIVGDGKVGNTLLDQLSIEGHNLVVIDNNLQKLEETSNRLDVMTVHGNGAYSHILSQAGVKNADLLIAVTSEDEINMISCMVAKKLGVKQTIARIRNTNFIDQLYLLKEELALSMLIIPENQAANDIARTLGFPEAIKVESLAKAKAELVELKIGENSPLHGMKLFEVYDKYKVRLLVCTIQRGEEVFIPDGNSVLKSGDKIFISSTRHDAITFLKKTNNNFKKIKNVMIVGGKRISYYLGKHLSEMGMNVKIIEQKEKTCLFLSDFLNKATIIHGDGTDQELLVEEGIDNMDAFISLTGNDEQDIIMAVYASVRGVPKVIARVDKLSYGSVLDKIGLDSVVMPKMITANSILRYVRAKQNSYGSNIETLYKLLDGKVEVAEFVANKTTKNLKRPLKDLQFKDGVLIVCILRDENKVIIPEGNTHIEIGDKVAVISKSGALHDLNDMFKIKIGKNV